MALSFSGLLAGALAVLLVFVALGMVIFVHELGHFLVAKLCGVKVEKFYLGFDIFGWRVLRFRFGQTEYGVGILPLGGYVKMLGQEDNPARLREEIERARRELVSRAASQSELEVLKEAESALYDPRSYLAQSVPRRMAIISAGVIMNLLFAVLCAAVAYRLGVKEMPAKVGGVVSGMGAWQVGLRPDDQILEIAGRRIETFSELREAVPVSDETDKGLSIVVRRPGVWDRREFFIRPDRSGMLPMIGVSSPLSTTLSRKGPPALPGSAAAKASPALRSGDRIVAVDEQPISRYGELAAYLTAHPDKEISLTIERRVALGPAGPQNGSPTPPDPAGNEDQPTETRRLVVRLGPQPMRRLGLVMKLGPVSAVQRGSPAEAAGIKPGDVLLAIDGQAPGDPMTLPYRLQKRTGETISLRVQRPGKPARTLELKATLRRVEQTAIPAHEGAPLDIPALGIACQVIGRVQDVLPDTPAARAGMKRGDVLTRAVVLPPKESAPQDAGGRPTELRQDKIELEISAEKPSWPTLIYGLQEFLPGTTVKLSWKRGEKPFTATLELWSDPNWFHAGRGLRLEPEQFTQVAQSWPAALRRGGKRTVEATLLVYRVLQRLGQRRISPKALVGPIGIFWAATQMAEEGLPKLLMFLTVISANLAVLNFLPIPVLDGGHMVFLIYEGIRGKPADERVQVGLAYLGLALLLGLMVWVLYLDLARLLG